MFFYYFNIYFNYMFQQLGKIVTLEFEMLCGDRFPPHRELMILVKNPWPQQQDEQISRYGNNDDTCQKLAWAAICVSAPQKRKARWISVQERISSDEFWENIIFIWETYQEFHSRGCLWPYSKKSKLLTENYSDYFKPYRLALGLLRV